MDIVGSYILASAFLVFISDGAGWLRWWFVFSIVCHTQEVPTSGFAPSFRYVLLSFLALGFCFLGPQCAYDQHSRYKINAGYYIAAYSTPKNRTAHSFVIFGGPRERYFFVPT